MVTDKCFLHQEKIYWYASDIQVNGNFKTPWDSLWQSSSLKSPVWICRWRKYRSLQNLNTWQWRTYLYAPFQALLLWGVPFHFATRPGVINDKVAQEKNQSTYHKLVKGAKPLLRTTTTSRCGSHPISIGLDQQRESLRFLAGFSGVTRGAIDVGLQCIRKKKYC